MQTYSAGRWLFWELFPWLRDSYASHLEVRMPERKGAGSLRVREVEEGLICKSVLGSGQFHTPSMTTDSGHRRHRCEGSKGASLEQSCSCNERTSPKGGAKEPGLTCSWRP